MLRKKFRGGSMKLKKSYLFLMVIFLLWPLNSLCVNRIAILGTGYVGLITGACFAEFGHEVMCADTDSAKINLLQKNSMPIYEPGLKELVSRNVERGLLRFTTDIHQAIAEADGIFIAVGTPMDSNGCADLSALSNAFSMIIPHLDHYKIICIKSTVPIGTGESLVQLLEESRVDKANYDLVSNPEFLREGSAIGDFMNPDRIIVGAYSENARDWMRNVYAPLLEKNVPCIFTSIASAETIKYASNAFLATKLSFINEIANLCDQTGADVFDVAQGMGLDNRIGQAFLKPGPGFGGSCFPKDCHALEGLGKKFGIHLNVVTAALTANEEQKKKPVEKLRMLLPGPLHQKTVALLGLAFKSNTDDVRYSPAITTIEVLLQEGARIKAYDPVAIENMRKLFPDIIYVQSIYEAVSGADAIIIMTEWDEFKYIDLGVLAKLVKEKVIVDARNLLDPQELKKFGFSYAMIGRP